MPTHNRKHYNLFSWKKNTLIVEVERGVAGASGEVRWLAHLVKVDPDGAHVGGAHSCKREEAVLPLAGESNTLVEAEELLD